MGEFKIGTQSCRVDCLEAEFDHRRRRCTVQFSCSPPFILDRDVEKKNYMCIHVAILHISWRFMRSWFVRGSMHSFQSSKLSSPRLVTSNNYLHFVIYTSKLFFFFDTQLRHIQDWYLFILQNKLFTISSGLSHDDALRHDITFYKLMNRYHHDDHGIRWRVHTR